MGMLDQDEIRRRMGLLDGWLYTEQGIQKRFELGSFASVMNLVKRVADLAEEADHHPEILIQFDQVTFTLTTHQAAGVTEKDFELAQRIEAIAP